MAYGTIVLFLEQIAPSPAAHARTCCQDCCGCRAGEMASEIHEIFYAFGPQLNTFMSVGIWLIFVVSCSSLSEVSSVEFRYVQLYITNQVVFRYFFYKIFTFLHSKFHKCRRLTAFP